nr:MAG TPA: hypothetical protein [Bacteriophage sp.]
MTDLRKTDDALKRRLTLAGLIKRVGRWRYIALLCDVLLLELCSFSGIPQTSGKNINHFFYPLFREKAKSRLFNCIRVLLLTEYVSHRVQRCAMLCGQIVVWGTGGRYSGYRHIGKAEHKIGCYIEMLTKFDDKIK